VVASREISQRTAKGEVSIESSRSNAFIAMTSS
jgi:hypothetical protein